MAGLEDRRISSSREMEFIEVGTMKNEYLRFWEFMAPLPFAQAQP
jgi:hypothetical protein